MKKLKSILLLFLSMITIVIFLNNFNLYVMNSELELSAADTSSIHSQKCYNLDVTGFQKVISGQNILVIEKAFIRNDGENNFWRGDGDIGLHIYYYKAGNWKVFKNMRLYGPHYHGKDTDGSEKYEWSDYSGVIYKNYGIINWKDFPGDSMRILLVEGDHGLTKDDIVFDKNLEVEKLKTGNLVRVDGDLSKQEATLWFRTYNVLHKGINKTSN